MSSAQTTLSTSATPIASGAATVVTSDGASPTEPCALISSAQAESLSVIIRADAAYDCYQSVPVNTDGDLQLIDELKLFLQWNTDTERFKDLPDWVSHNTSTV